MNLHIKSAIFVVICPYIQWGECTSLTPSTHTEDKKVIEKCEAISLDSRLTPLQWLPAGRGLLIDNLWVFDPLTKHFKTWPHQGKNLFSPDGKQVAVQKADRIEIYPSWQEVVKVDIAIPMFLAYPKNIESENKYGIKAKIANEIREQSILTWLDSNQLLLYQSLFPHTDGDCRVFHVEKGIWQVPQGGCPEGEFYDIFDIQKGLGHGFTVHSVAEGHPDFTIALYTPHEGQKLPKKAPHFNLYPHGFVEVYWRASGHFLLMTDCLLEEEIPCNIDGRNLVCWHLYHWSALTNQYTLLQKNLMPGTIFDPVTHQLAWVDGKQVCWQAQLHEHCQPSCYPLPAPVFERMVDYKNHTSLQIQLFMLDHLSNWHYKFVVRDKWNRRKYVQSFLIRNGVALNPEDMKLLDINADGFKDLQILGGVDRSGQKWYKSWHFDPQQQRYQWNDSVMQHSSDEKEK